MAGDSRQIKAWSKAKKLLCVRLDALGDVLMTTPALAALKQQNPQRQITLLCSKAGQAAAEYIPQVDRMIPYEAPWMKGTRQEGLAQDRQLIERLRCEAFDAAVIFTVYSQNPLPAALLCFLSEIPLRLAHCRENPYELLTDWLPEMEPHAVVRHEVERQLALVEAIGCAVPKSSHLSLRVCPRARQRIEELSQELGIDCKQPIVLVHPGASAPSRRYRPDGFAQVARELVSQDGVQVIFTGSPEEVELVRHIQAAMQAPSQSLAGLLDFAQLTALIAQSSLLLSNNSGPVHIAAAVGTPVVDLYALTNPQHLPWQVACRVLYMDVPCRFCYKSVCPVGHNACLQTISPDDILAAIRALWYDDISEFYALPTAPGDPCQGPLKLLRDQGGGGNRHV